MRWLIGLDGRKEEREVWRRCRGIPHLAARVERGGGLAGAGGLQAPRAPTESNASLSIPLPTQLDSPTPAEDSAPSSLCLCCVSVSGRQMLFLRKIYKRRVFNWSHFSWLMLAVLGFFGNGDTFVLGGNVAKKEQKGEVNRI